MNPLESIRTFGVRVGASLLYYSGSVGLLQRAYKRRHTLSDGGTTGDQRFLILLYHRISFASDPLFPGLSASVFEKQAGYFARSFRVATLAEIIQRIES